VSTDADRAAELRNAMVDDIAADHEAKELTLRPEVEAALRTVPRHLFTPGVSMEEAYAATSSIITKQLPSGESISSVSAPYLIAEMLGQAADALDGLEGRHVLEIGSGGYNASLLAELVGKTGSVTTVDIDPEVTARATACLKDAGYDDVVTVVCADAEQVIEPARQYDLIIVTAGAWDIPPAWREQLTEGGVLVVPLRTCGTTRSWALHRRGDRLVSHSHRQCGFVPVQGAGAHPTRYLDVADGVYLRLDEGERIDPDAVKGVLSQPRREAWAGLSLPPMTALHDLSMWHATRLREHAVVLTAEEKAIASGLVAPSWPYGTSATWHNGTLAYRTIRWTDRRFDLGAYAHGPDAQAAAERMVEDMRAWAEAGCPTPALEVFPIDTPDSDLPDGAVLDKRHSRLVVSFR